MFFCDSTFISCQGAIICFSSELILPENNKSPEHIMTLIHVADCDTITEIRRKNKLSLVYSLMTSSKAVRATKKKQYTHFFIAVVRTTVIITKQSLVFF